MPEQIDTVNGNATEESKTEPQNENLIASPVKNVPSETSELHQEQPVANENGHSVEDQSESDNNHENPEVIACTFVPKETEATKEETESKPEISEEPQCPLPPKVVSIEPLEPISVPDPQPAETLNGDSVAENKSEPEPIVQITFEAAQNDDRNETQNGNGELKADAEPKKELISENNHNTEGQPKKGALLTNLDIKSVKAAYEEVRSDGNDTQWAVFKFEGPQIKCSAKGSDFKQFRSQFSEDERAFGYIRIQTGDEMSKRQKFLLLTWVGQSVSVLKRAKMSTDKSLIKDIVSNFAVELQTENLSDLDLDYFVSELNKAGGANYGTGIRQT